MLSAAIWVHLYVNEYNDGLVDCNDSDCRFFDFCRNIADNSGVFIPNAFAPSSYSCFWFFIFSVVCGFLILLHNKITSLYIQLFIRRVTH